MSEKGKKKGFEFPDVYALVFIMCIVAMVATWIVPAGTFDRVTEGNLTKVVAGSFHLIDKVPQTPWDMLQAIFQGMLNSSGTIFMIIFCGAAINMLNESNALTAAFSSLAKKLQGKEALAIAVVMFALGLGNAAGVMYDNVPYLWQAEFVPTCLKTHPNESIPDSLQLVFLPGDADGNYYETYSYNMTAVCLGSSAADGRMDRILTMLDWLCSEEGSRLRRYGLEGEDYRIGSNRAIVRLNDDTSLYSKYPSYAFFRILPNQDTMAFWRDESGNALTRFVTRQFTAWREQHDVQTLFLTSIRANTVSTPAVLNFHPDIMDSAYRLLIAEDMDAQFELIRNEYRENGIESMIDSVHYHIN